MRHTLLIILISLIVLSCNQPEISKIEVIKLDQKMVDSLTLSSDTSYSVNLGREEFHTADYYIIYKDSILTKILRDSFGNAMWITRSQKGNHIFGIEYYANGQLKGKIYHENGQVEGPVIYYYEDGRIRSTGQWHNLKQIGIWKNYQEDGKLDEIEYYDSTGKIVKNRKTVRKNGTKK